MTGKRPIQSKQRHFPFVIRTSPRLWWILQGPVPSEGEMMNSYSAQEKVSHDSDDHSLSGVLRAIASRGHSHMGPRIRILLAPHPRAIFGGRHDLHRLESCCRPIYVRDRKPRWLTANLDDARDTCEPFASSFPYITFRSR